MNAPPHEVLIGEIVLWWGRIENNLNALLEYATDPELERTRPHQFEKRLKAWRAFHEQSPLQGHPEKAKKLYEDLLKARIDRNLLVHSLVIQRPHPEGKPNGVECMIREHDKTTIKRDYERMVKRLKARGVTALIPKDRMQEHVKNRIPEPIEYSQSDLERIARKDLFDLYFRAMELNSIRKGEEHDKMMREVRGQANWAMNLVKHGVPDLQVKRVSLNERLKMFCKFLYKLVLRALGR